MIPETKRGRELDAEVAEKVMGFRWWENSANGLCYLLRETPRRSRNEATNAIWVECAAQPVDFARRWYSDGVPCFSTDIAAAWLVVEKLRGMDCGVHLNCYVTSWDCEIVNPGGLSCVVRDQPTAPLAICLAALKAPEEFERPDFFAETSDPA